MGSTPHLLYQATQERRALLLRGCPTLPFLLGCPPHLPLILHAVRMELMLIRGAPSSSSCFGGFPPFLACMPCVKCAYCC